jgi:hypothetical protein
MIVKQIRLDRTSNSRAIVYSKKVRNVIHYLDDFSLLKMFNLTITSLKIGITSNRNMELFKMGVNRVRLNLTYKLMMSKLIPQ